MPLLASPKGKSDGGYAVADFRTLIPVTIGNIIGGGLLVGLTYWVIYLRENDHH